MVTISVITPTYDRGDLIPRAIESVLSQTFEDFEYIIVDDASTDHTPSVVDGYGDPRIRYLSHVTNRRQGAARNTGIDAASGEYIAFLDSDDEWLPEKLEKQVACLESKSEEWVGVYCDNISRRTNWAKDVLTSLFPYEIRKEGGEELMRDILTMQGSISAGSSLLVRSDAVDDVGGFDETFPRHEELDFVFQLLQQGKFAYIDEELVLVHETGDPSAELVEMSKQKLFEKYADEIAQAEDEGIPIRKYHKFYLARCYFTEGSFRIGWQYLKGSKASNPRQLIRLLVAIQQGIRQIMI